MPLDFHQSRNAPESRRPPPDYFSRRVKLRLFTLVALVMLVLWFMTEARKPQNWYWMWGGNPNFAGGPPLTKDETAGGSEDVDTRLQITPNATQDPDVFTAPGQEPSLWNDDEDELTALTVSQDERLERTRRDGWSHVLHLLDSEQDAALRKTLKSTRESAALDELTLQNWPAVLEQLELGWDQYLQEGFQYLLAARGKLNEEQQAAWHKAVQALEIEWRQQVQPALKAAGAGEALAPEQRQALAAVQTTLDQVALSAVRDNTVFRSSERHAWFRLLEQLDQQSLASLEQASPQRVGFLQLFEQSNVYRGRLVTVRGTATLGYRVQAPSNIYGIKEYSVFWIAPAGGPNSPIAVYALQPPEGFPALKDKDRDRATTPLNEEMEFTGYYFKRWAYPARDGLRIAPLLLAKTARWTPPPESLAKDQTLNPYALAMYLCGAMAVGASIALVAYWQGQRRSTKSRIYAASPDRFAQRLQALEQEDPAEDVRETLRRLSNEQKTP